MAATRQVAVTPKLREAGAGMPDASPWPWTDRMLATLRKGVKGGKWYSLSDKVWHLQTLFQAWQQVRRNGGGRGVDGQSLMAFEEALDHELRQLHDELRTGRYRPRAIKRVWIPKPGSLDKRPLGIPTVRDRVVQTALRMVIEPIFEHRFAEHSYGFRPGRGCKDALRQVDQLLKAGHAWVVDADLKSYFDTIPHEPLMNLLREELADQRLLDWLAGFLKQGIVEALKEWTPLNGTPQGAVISPLLANVYLNGLDHEMARQGYHMVRYADDFVILCRTKAEAEAALALVRAWVSQAGLTLQPEKTRIVEHEHTGFDFLGYHFSGHHRWPRQKSLERFKAKLRELTQRRNGESLHETIVRLNPALRGWYGYFKHSDHQIFERLDGWIRHRLRSLLLWREGIHRWKVTRHDHQRWPNAFFARNGLYSLHAAYTRELLTL
mgnify:CR=1 FL=1